MKFETVVVDISKSLSSKGSKQVSIAGKEKWDSLTESRSLRIALTGSIEPGESEEEVMDAMIQKVGAKIRQVLPDPGDEDGEYIED